MPMIVRHSAIPLVRWPIASHQPMRMIQMMLPISEAIPASRRITIDRPKGQMT